jgi:uncharacterized protein (DUF433 family)
MVGSADHMEESLRYPIVSDAEVVSGTPVFAGTRVPAQILLDYLIAGDGPASFLAQFPSVSRQQAMEALEITRDALLACA